MDSILAGQIEWLISGNMEGLRFKRQRLLAGCLADDAIPDNIEQKLSWLTKLNAGEEDSITCSICRTPDTEREAGDVWLQFCTRGEEARLLRLTANRSHVTSWFGPSSWCLRVVVEQALPAEILSHRNPLRPNIPSNDEPPRAWALTEVCVSPVPCNILAPQGYCLQNICGGLALHFSNNTEADYGRLLGATYEHHNEDAPHEYFCADILPPLTGSGPWRRMAYLADNTLRDDDEVGLGDDSDYRGPAVLGYQERFNRELEQFQKWFEKEASFHALRCEATRHWYRHYVDHLNDLEEMQSWAESPAYPGHPGDTATGGRQVRPMYSVFRCLVGAGQRARINSKIPSLR